MKTIDVNCPTCGKLRRIDPEDTRDNRYGYCCNSQCAVGPLKLPRIIAGEDIENLVEASKSFVKKTGEVAEALSGVLHIAAIHGSPYTGPTQNKERDTLLKALKPFLEEQERK